MRIEKLEPSQHKQGRWLVWLDDASVVRVGEGDVVSLGLYAGRELTDAEGEALCAAGEQSRLMERAVGLLAQRPMSRKELLDKLCVPPRQKREKYPYDKLDGGPDPALLQQQKEALRERAEGVADRLAGLGLLNDGEYARMVVRHYAAKGYGPGGCPGSSGRTPWTNGSRTAARLTSWPGRSSGGRSPRGKI